MYECLMPIYVIHFYLTQVILKRINVFIAKNHLQFNEYIRPLFQFCQHHTAISALKFQYRTKTSTFKNTTIHRLVGIVSFGSSSTGTIRQERSKRINLLYFASLQNVLFKDDQIESPIHYRDKVYRITVLKLRSN